MSDMSAGSWLLAGLGCLAFACFTWGTLRHFAREGAPPRGTLVISLLSALIFALFIWRLAKGLVSPAWPVAAIMLVGSVAIWAWTLRQTWSAPPTLAFTEDTPRSLFDGGPYKWVRHPFYTAYMTCWMGTALGTQGWVGWVAAATIGAVYWGAARHEEGKFARSPLAADYMAYQSRTGMFAPRLLK